MQFQCYLVGSLALSSMPISLLLFAFDNSYIIMFSELLPLNRTLSFKMRVVIFTHQVGTDVLLFDLHFSCKWVNTSINYIRMPFVQFYYQRQNVASNLNALQMYGCLTFKQTNIHSTDYIFVFEVYAKLKWNIKETCFSNVQV